MKTLVKMMTMALVFVFITTNTIEAQSTISSQIFDEGCFEVLAVSDNDTYVTIAVNGINGNEGLSKLIKKQTDGSYNVLKTYILTPGSGPNGGLGSFVITISNNGNSYVGYGYDIIGDDGYLRLQKNLLNGSNLSVFEYSNGGISKMKVIEDLYLIMGAGPNFDPGILGGLPNLNEGVYLIKVDGTTNQYVWSTLLETEQQAVEILEMPNGNIAVAMFNADLIEFDSSTGTEIRIIKEGNMDDNRFDKYKFDNDGNLHHQDDSEHSLTIYDGNDNYNSIIYQTDWTNWNLWSRSLDDWKIIDGITYALRSERILHLNDKLIHGYISMINLDEYGASGSAKWVNNDGTFSYMKIDENIINLVTLTEESEDESLIPSLNDSDVNIVAVLNGYTYNGENWNGAYHQSTIVFEDGTLPSIGENPNESWIDAAPGTWQVILFPIESDPRSDALIFRGIYRKNGTAEHDINIKVLLKEESDVELDNYVVSIEKTLNGAEPNTNANFTVTVSPTNNTGVPITGDIAYTGTATEWDDYDGVSNFSIPNGSSSTIVILTTNDDTDIEGTETIIATISNPSTGVLGTDNDTADLVDDDIVNIKELNETTISLYPNPATSFINISSDLKINEIQIYNISGKLCFQKNLDLKDRINISTLKSGLYFINILVNDKIITKKFIKNSQ